jgi:hypothetical protein
MTTPPDPDYPDPPNGRREPEEEPRGWRTWPGRFWEYLKTRDVADPDESRSTPRPVGEFFIQRPPFISRLLARRGARVFEVETRQNVFEIPPRSLALRPRCPSFHAMEPHDVYPITRSRLTWLWPRRIGSLLIALVVVFAALLSSRSASSWIIALLAILGAWITLGILNAAWFNKEVSVKLHMVEPHEGIFRPRSPLKVGSIGSEDISGVDIRTNWIWNLLGLDVGTITIFTTDNEELVMKHVPDVYNVRALLNNVNTKGGPSNVQDLLLLLVMQGLVGRLTDAAVDNVLGRGAASRMRRDAQDIPPDDWPGGG